MTRFLLPLIMLALPAGADMTYPDGSPVECYCTDSTGGRVELGQRICLSVGGRSFEALCDMSQNVTIWRDTGNACPMG